MDAKNRAGAAAQSATLKVSRAAPGAVSYTAFDHVVGCPQRPDCVGDASRIVFSIGSEVVAYDLLL